MLLTSIDVAVPRACAAVPIDSPCAFALRTRAKPIVLYPHTAHSKPTLTTTAAVSEGMPPTAFVTSMAIGVVTDFDAGLHFGHQTKRWNPKMKPYIFDKRNGIHIIDLTQTVTFIDEAAEFLRKTVLEGKKILFVATKKQAQEIVKQAAESCVKLR